MNKIFKVIYSKTRHCYVVVSELAKNQGKSEKSKYGMKRHNRFYRLAAIVALAISTGSLLYPMQAEAATDLSTNDYFTAYDKNYFDKDGNKSDDWKKAKISNTDQDKENVGAKGTGAIAAGLYAQAGQQTVTIGNRNAGQSMGSVFIGEYKGYYNPSGNQPQGLGNNYVTSVGFMSHATKYGTIAIGAGASAEGEDNNVTLGNKDSSGTLVSSLPDPEKLKISGASVSLGYSAQSKSGNIAIGAYSDATTDLSADTSDKAKSYLTEKNATSYVSVGSKDVQRRISNVADGAADTDVATIAQLRKVADNKVAWKLTTAGDNANASTVSAGDTVDFSAAKDSKENGQATGNDHSNLTISKENGTNGTNNKVNMTVGLSNNVVLGQNVSGEGGSLDVYRAVGDASSDTETNENNQSYDQLGSHVRIDGSTVSVHYDNGTDSDARGAVLGIANDSYQDTKDATKTVSSPLGYVYLQDGKNYYYLHGAMHGDTKYQGRLAYDSSESGYNYIANLDDGLKFTGDTENTTVETKLDPNAANNTLSITGGVTDSGKLTSGNIGVVATAGGLSIQLAKDLTDITSITSQTTGSTTGAKVTLDTKDNNIDVNYGKVTNLSDGTVDATSTDAVTGKQLYNLDNSSVKYDTNGTTVDKTKITLAGGATGTTITNVKAGTISANSTDAVNGAQLYAEQQARAQDKTKYYSAHEGPQIADFSTNENNDGASAWAGLAAGYETGTAGIGSTVVGSYSGVMNTGTVSDGDLRGAASLSMGTLNLNQNNDTSKKYSGVANSIVGQGNVTTNSNAAIIIGAGNTITDSYRDVTIDTSTMKGSTPEELEDALQTAVPNSGAQVMAIGGGNKITSAYKTQVVGVGNTVSDTELNYVDGFNNTVTHGKSNYIIGAKNTLDSGNNNVIFGDNHKLSSKSNNVIIGSADDENKELTASNAVVIGHNADVSVDGGVAIGSGSEATVAGKTTEGYNPTTGQTSTDTTATWKATNAAVSIGKADGTVTRQINGVAAGTNDTDAVNVAQLKKLEGMKANVDALNIGKNITVAPIYKTDDNGQKVIDQKATEDAQEAARTANENAWGTAIGTGEIAKDNGQLVTGKTVYDALHGGLDDVVFGHDGKDGTDGKDGSIGLNGKNGKDGKDGITTTIIKTEKGQPGEKGETGAPGVDGKDITRIVYQNDTNGDGKHTVATLDDGMKYVGDTGNVANVKLDHQLKLSGTTFDEKDENKKYKDTDWTSGNIAVVSGAADEKTGDATMYLKLNKDLNLTDKGSVRFGDKNSSTTLDASGLTIKSTVTKEGKTETVNGPSITIDGIDGGNKAITNIGSGIEKDAKGNYTDKSKSSAANINDVQTIVNDAKKDLTEGTNGLNNKANVDASNIGNNLTVAPIYKKDTSTGKEILGNDGKPIVDEYATKAATEKAREDNKNAWASAIGTDKVEAGNKQLVTSDAVATALDKKADKSYVDQELGKKADKTYVDEKLDTKANKLDVYTKTEVDSKVADITNGLGDKANKDLDNISDKGKTVIKNLAKGAVKVIAGTNTTITEGKDGDAKTYAVNVENGKVASGDTGLISGDTLYKEVHVGTDGTYVKSKDSAGHDMTVAQNLSALDTDLKTTSDLIHTNTKGDTIQIGGSSSASKIDVNGKDGKGRVITGVVSDANDPNSAANVGYVNGLTAANTQQIYRDMNNAYSRLDTNINRAAAGSNALAALHPLDFDPADKASFAVGYGHYRNANAAAVGAFYQPNANTMVNMGISLGNGDPGFNAGVSFKIGKGSAYNGVSKAEMAQTIHDQATEISAIKADDAAKDKRIDALEKENQEMKKQIQEILARLNG